MKSNPFLFCLAFLFEAEAASFTFGNDDVSDSVDGDFQVGEKFTLSLPGIILEGEFEGEFIDMVAHCDFLVDDKLIAKKVSPCFFDEFNNDVTLIISQ